tara:strand:+ start:32688 stop:35054 length:2367 start_codon:yes stop_codon:yes gene_type:complete
LKNKLTLLFLLASFAMMAQEKFTLSGTISEAQSGETMIGVNVLIPSLQTGVITNEYGFYSITLPKGSHQIIYTSLGFGEFKETILLKASINKNVTLFESTELLDVVILETDVEKTNIRTPQMSATTLKANTIKRIPVVLGEADVIKAITLLPGVTNAGEGASGFNVRGGASDQNLVLLDEATLYNSSHLFGFFSVFNPDAIKDLTLYKGGIPARYGGRISSVLDIYQKDGNKRKYVATGGIGLLASRLLIEGPILKDKASFLIGGRSTYAHLFIPLVDPGNNNVAYFYDLNTKLSYDLDNENKLFLSGYFGRDTFNLGEIFGNTFGNTTVNLRWNHLFNSKLFSNLSLIYSDYYYGLELKFAEFQFDSGIRNFNLKYDFTNYVSDKVKLQFGFNSIYYKFNPGEVSPTSGTSGINYRKLTDKYAFENAVYIDGNFKVSEKLNIQAGLRLSSFTRLGQESINVYANNNPIIYNEAIDVYQKASPIDTISISRGSSIKSFFNLEPRISAAYQISETSSVKASYNRTAQYIHLISNTSSPTPFDIYAPSGQFIEPQLGDQVAVGYFKAFENFSLEAEAYYKEVQNRIDYVDDADLIANEAIEQVVLNGEARAYGLEFLVRKTKGKLKGWVSYTLSKSEQRTPGRTAIETGINSGKWYNTAWDRTHDFSITTQYELSKRWFLGANFIYQTGRPSTFPLGQYEYQGQIVPVYEARNASRLAHFHHLDISATWNLNHKNKKRWNDELVFSIYNVYNRKNAASVSFRKNTDTGNNEAIRLSIFGIIPAITYNFKF